MPEAVSLSSRIGASTRPATSQPKKPAAMSATTAMPVIVQIVAHASSYSPARNSTMTSCAVWDCPSICTGMIA